MSEDNRCKLQKVGGLLFFCLLLIVMTVLHERTASAADQNMSWKGYVSNQKEKFIKVVAARDEWTKLWKRAFDKPAPDVDFEKSAVACVFLGHSVKWLYSIHVGEPFRRDDKWIIKYGLVEMILRLKGPFKAGGQYYMKVIERKDSTMFLEESVLH